MKSKDNKTSDELIKRLRDGAESSYVAARVLVTSVSTVFLSFTLGSSKEIVDSNISAPFSLIVMVWSLLLAILFSWLSTLLGSKLANLMVGFPKVKNTEKECKYTIKIERASIQHVIFIICHVQPSSQEWLMWVSFNLSAFNYELVSDAFWFSIKVFL